MHETIVNGFKNRVLQRLAMSLPGGTRVRVPLHRLRGVKIGDGVWIGSDVMIETAHPSLVSIGNRVVVGVRTTILAHFQEVMGIKIGDDVYIGACATLLPGIVIGAGSVISAGSVVTTSVPPKTLVQGNPAKRVATCGIPLGLSTSRADFVKHLKRLDSQRPV